jgi:hypothetical protein
MGRWKGKSGLFNMILFSFLHFMIFHHQNDKVSQYMIKFRRHASQPYSLITPSTPLADLELFLRNNIFALGTPLLCPFRVLQLIICLLPVTDLDRKFVLAVATSQDLEVGKWGTFYLLLSFSESCHTELRFPSWFLNQFTGFQMLIWKRGLSSAISTWHMRALLHIGVDFIAVYIIIVHYIYWPLHTSVSIKFDSLDAEIVSD